MKCHDCGQIQEDVETLKEHLLQLNEKVEATNEKMENNHVKAKKVVRKLGARLTEKEEVLKTSQDQITQNQQYVKHEVTAVKKELKDPKENVSTVNKDVNEVKVMTMQVSEKLNMLEQHSKVSSPTVGILNTPKEDILVAGSSWMGNALKSTKIYSWEKNDWFTMSDMNGQHWNASSFIYNDQVFVVRGFCSKTIETFDYL